MEAIVEYNYVAQEPDELTIRKGDIIKEIKVMLGGWWEGTLRDKRGMFPDNFVKVIEPSSTNTSLSGGGSCGDNGGSIKSEEVTLREGGSGRRWCKVLFSYEPCNDDELMLIPQDSIEFLGEVEEGWWRGRLRGRVGVFPSNFVSPPIYEKQEKYKERDKKELCRVLFPYEAANEDELTLVEGDIITLISKDAPDVGWWKGELNGQIGLFPDNFVEVITVKNEHQDSDQWHDTTQIGTKATKHSHQIKKSEKAHIRKSLDIRSSHTETTKKAASTPSPTPMSSSSSLTCLGGGSGEKKSVGNHFLVSIKRLVGDVGNNNGNGTTNVALGEELDGVERGEGAPLSHLTASRAKAPRRRPPSSQRLRHHAAAHTTTSTGTPTNPKAPSTILEDNLANGNGESTLDQLREDDAEGLAVKARKKAPWVEELKLNQMERRKVVSTDRIDKPDVKKEKSHPRITPPSLDATIKSEVDSEDGKSKEKEKSPKSEANTDHLYGVAAGCTAYVPYRLYSQLLERVVALEEKQAILQQTVGQLSEQLTPLLANPSINSKV